MTKKKTTAGKKKKGGFKGDWIVRNLVLAAVAVVSLLLIVSLLLSIFTQHGKEITAPDFTNMTWEEAREVASRAGVRVVQSDSVYVRAMRRGAVYNQNPKPGEMVKHGRRIMLTTNSLSPRKVAMPSLVGLSMRQAKTELSSRSLVLGKLIYVRDIATNIVIRQQVGGEDIRPGTMVRGGTVVNLVVGMDPVEGRTYIPNLVGRKYMRAVETIQDNSLNVGKVEFDRSVRTYADTVNAVVRSQSPAVLDHSVPMGTEVSLKLSVHPSPEAR